MERFAACEATREGITLMQAGRPDEAHAMFRHALALLRQLIQTDTGTTLAPDKEHRSVVLQRTQLMITEDNNTALSNGGCFEIYPYAFSILFRETPDEFDYALALATVLYNLALNEQVSSTFYAKHSHTLRALRYYSLARRVLDSVGPIRPSTVDDSPLVTLALWNNEAHCRSSTLDWRACQYCRDCLEASFSRSLHVLLEADRIFFQMACLIGKTIHPEEVAPAA